MKARRLAVALDVRIISDMAHARWKAIARRARAVGRRLTPPGNRTPIEESGEQRPGLPSFGGVPSGAGQQGQTLGGGYGGV
jgi:hypothetical protein